MMEGNSPIMTLEETAKYLKIGKSTLYKMTREGKILLIAFNRRWNMTKNKNSHPEGCICEQFAYLPNMVVYPNLIRIYRVI